MSVAAIDRVISHCPEKGGEYTVLLVIANRADAAGRGAWFDEERIARDARLGVPYTKKILHELVQSGRLTVRFGAGRKGDQYIDVLDIVFPPAALPAGVSPARRPRTARAGSSRRTAAASRKPAVRHSDPGDRAADLTVMNLNSSLNLAKFFASDNLNPSPKSTQISLESKKFYAENAIKHAPGADFSPWYVLFTPLKDLVIPLGLDTHAQQSTPAPLLDQPDLDDWDPADEKLFGSITDNDQDMPDTASGEATPDGVIGGASHPVQEPVKGDGDDENVTDFEQVPPGRRTRFAAPTDPEYLRLKALCGGSLKEPLLLTYLSEQTRGQNSRKLWLTLTLDEIEHARLAAKNTPDTVFRTAFVEHLDALVDGVHVAQLRLERRDAPRRFRLPVEQQARPGDGDSAARENPFTVGMRVRAGDQLGVILGASADARQAAITVDFDDGTRAGYVGEELRLVSHAPDAPPAPTLAPQLAVGTRWRHRSTGRILTVTALSLGRPTTDDNTTWAAFGPGALTRHADPAPDGAAHGAA